MSTFVSKRNALILFLNAIALAFLIPGITLSMLTINTHSSVNTVLTDFNFDVFDTSNSILTTVYDLFALEYYFVSIMVFTFSVVVPVAKSIMLMYLVFSRHWLRQVKTLKWMNRIAKWSMCDVFIVAVFLAYLSTGSRSKGSSHQASILGVPIDIDVLVNMNAKLEVGFYCFLIYCLLSLTAVALYRLPKAPLDATDTKEDEVAPPQGS